MQSYCRDFSHTIPKSVRLPWACRVMIVGKGCFAVAVNEALLKVGFHNIRYVEAPAGAAEIAADPPFLGKRLPFGILAQLPILNTEPTY